MRKGINSSTTPDLPRVAPTEDLVLSGQQLGTVQCCHGPDVVYAVLGNSGHKALPIIDSRTRASASLMPLARIRNLSPVSVLPNREYWTNHHKGRMVNRQETPSLPKWRAVACQQCCRLVIAPKRRLLWDSYLSRQTIVVILETLSGS